MHVGAVASPTQRLGTDPSFVCPAAFDSIDFEPASRPAPTRETHMTARHIHPATHQPTPALLLVTGSTASPERDSSVSELGSLLRDLGFTVDRVVRQRRPPTGEVVGPGKLEELKLEVEELRKPDAPAPCVVLVGEAPPGRIRWLSRQLEVPVVDRTEIILRVFETRARSRLAHLEIELARLVYELPRIRDDTSLGDKEGGGGRGGRGHSNVELAKQRIRRRIADLRRQIAELRVQRLRTSDRRRQLPRVALVGYTNAGKSSWMRALTGSSSGVADRLFATVDTTVRALARNPGPRVLVADTVGFMADLPHGLFESFRSTLEEALDADLILHVADASHPRVHEQITVTERALEEISTRAKRTFLLLNKADRLRPEERAELEQRYPEALIVASHDPDDIHEVTSTIRAFVEDEL